MPLAATAAFVPVRGLVDVDQIASAVRRLLSAAHPLSGGQRREHQRVPFPQLLKLEPVDPATLAPQDDPIVVVGKQLSEQGIGFFHRDPLPHRFVAAAFELPGGDALRLLIDVSWCRFTRHGWYESGGRFVRVLE